MSRFACPIPAESCFQSPQSPHAVERVAIDSYTFVPEDLFEDMMRAAKLADSSGQHRLAARPFGSPCSSRRLVRNGCAAVDDDDDQSPVFDEARLEASILIVAS